MKKETLASALLFLLLIGPSVTIPEVVSVLAAVVVGVWLFVDGFRVPRALIVGALPLLLIVGIGVANAEGARSWPIMRDAWYLAKAIALFSAAFLSARHMEITKTLRVFLWAAVVSVVVHLTQFLIQPHLLGASLRDIRQEAGTGLFLATAALAILSSGRRARIRLLPPVLAWLVIASCAASLALAFSRTWLISLAIMLFVSEGGLRFLKWRQYDYRGTVRFMVASVGFALAILTFFHIASRTEAGSEFLWKLQRSFREMAASDYHSRTEMRINWRGYEAHRALTTYSESTPFELLVGKGYGTDIDMAVHTTLNNEVMRFVPTIHNGYVYLLLKTGILGSLLYALFFLRVLRLGYGEIGAIDSATRMTGELIVGAALVLLATTLTIRGPMSTHSLNSAVMLLGAMVAVSTKRRVEARHPVSMTPPDVEFSGSP